MLYPSTIGPHRDGDGWRCSWQVRIGRLYPQNGGAGALGGAAASALDAALPETVSWRLARERRSIEVFYD